VTPRYSLQRLWNWGIGLLIVGDIGLHSFLYSETSYATSSAYWYMLFQVGYAGIALCVAVLALGRTGVKTGSLVLFAALAWLLVAPFLLNARRGPTYTTIIAAAFSYLLVRPSTLKLWKVMGTLGAGGLLMIVLVHARGYLNRGLSWQSAMQAGTTEAVQEKRSTQVADNEFVNHAVKIEANLETGMYQYGTVHLAMLAHWIPRAIWPGKPQRSMGLYPAAMFHFKPGFYTNLGLGGAWGPVADGFDNYWHLCPVFWFLIGWGSVALYKRALGQERLDWKMYYLAVLMSAHWFFAQCFTEALVPFMFYQASFWLAFRFSRLPDTAVRTQRVLRRRPCPLRARCS
jgi:hypothetical protein